MKRNTPDPDRLSRLEHLVMDFIWADGAATAEQVRDGLAEEWPMKDSTVRTILRRLEDKGFLEHTVDGRTYIYRGVEAPTNLAIRAVRQIIDRFCHGSVESLLVGMVENEVIDKDQLERLARKAGSDTMVNDTKDSKRRK
jgi:predicted transcriptional regulator